MTTVIDVQSHVQTVIEAFARGEIVVVTDDDDRENEGDLVLAAVHATPEKMAFIVRNTCGKKTDGRHLLRDLQLFFELDPIRDVLEDDDRPGR